MTTVINVRDAAQLRNGLISINPDVSHRATEPPAPSEIYTPPHHISALDPDNSLVVGIRGVGKSFWASALGDTAAREVAAAAYPRLSLEKYIVTYGFTGFEGSYAPSPETLQQYAQAPESARLFWRVVVLRELFRTTQVAPIVTYSEAMKMFIDSETRETAMREADASLADRNQRLLLIFDALDTLSNDWPKLRMLTRSLLEVTYAMRSYRSLRLKLFLRPEQLDDPSVGFTDLSKLKAGKIDLSWDNVDLYGLLFSRLANEQNSRAAFARVVDRERVNLIGNGLIRLPNSLARDKKTQERVFVQLAGPYMGSDHRKGKTYTWLPSHLADGFRLVTPRSFLTALRRAAEVSESARDRVFTIDGIKEGLRAASRVRVDQLKEEYKWIEFALLPLEGLRVPCNDTLIIERWRETKTVEAIERDAREKGYLAPSEMPVLGKSENAGRSALRERGLLATLLKIGVLEGRTDGRINMPDIFRIGAALIGRGRVAPEG
jgi:hypothetical protein